MLSYEENSDAFDFYLSHLPPKEQGRLKKFLMVFLHVFLNVFLQGMSVNWEQQRKLSILLTLEKTIPLNDCLNVCLMFCEKKLTNRWEKCLKKMSLGQVNPLGMVR